MRLASCKHCKWHFTPRMLPRKTMWKLICSALCERELRSFQICTALCRGTNQADTKICCCFRFECHRSSPLYHLTGFTEVVLFLLDSTAVVPILKKKRVCTRCSCCRFPGTTGRKLIMLRPGLHICWSESELCFFWFLLQNTRYCGFLNSTNLDTKLFSCALVQVFSKEVILADVHTVKSSLENDTVPSGGDNRSEGRRLDYSGKMVANTAFWCCWDKKYETAVTACSLSRQTLVRRDAVFSRILSTHAYS